MPTSTPDLRPAESGPGPLPKARSFPAGSGSLIESERTQPSMAIQPQDQATGADTCSAPIASSSGRDAHQDFTTEFVTDRRSRQTNGSLIAWRLDLEAHKRPL
jgi:hypothetical protein